MTDNLLNIIYWLAYTVLCLTTAINAILFMIGFEQFATNKLLASYDTRDNIVNFNLNVIPVTVIALVILGVLR